MLGALEMQKIVYVLSRDSETPLKLASPIQANENRTLTFDIVGVNVGFENPTFAAIELNYGESDRDETGQAAAVTKKYLTYYELDLSSNSISKKWNEVTERSASRLVAVPGSENGPGGILVLGDGNVSYQKPGHPMLSCTLPRRGGSTRTAMIVAYDVHVQAKKFGHFFFILQNEFGDLFKVQLECKNDSVTDILAYYFDTIPVTNAMCITKNGCLFAANDSGDHFSYVFTSLGGEDGETVSKASQNQGGAVPEFALRGLKNLELCDDSIPSLAPILEMQIGDFQSKRAHQMFALCGRGPRSTLRVLEPGLSASELASTSLPGNPFGVWTLRENAESPNHKYIVLSFVNATLVLEVGEGGSVKELKNSDIETDEPTVCVGEAGAVGFVQILKDKVRHVRASGQVEEIGFDGQNIEQAALNRRQIALALTGGTLVYLEMDETGSFHEVSRINLNESVVCLGLEKIPEGRQRTSYLAVGTNAERVGLYALDVSRMLKLVSSRHLQAMPHSVCLAKLASGSAYRTLSLNVGLRTGMLMRFNVDHASGELSGDRENLLGTGCVELCELEVGGNPAIMSLSPKPHLLYEHDAKLSLSNLAYSPLANAAPFVSEECEEGFVGINQDRLYFIASPENLNDAFSQQALPLRYTPRGMCQLELSHEQRTDSDGTYVVGIIESDHDVMEDGTGGATEEELQREGFEGFLSPPDFDVEEGEAVVSEQTGYRRPNSGVCWSSCLRIIEPKSGRTVSFEHFKRGESAVSIANIVFDVQQGTSYIVVGTVVELDQKTSLHKGGFLHVYKLSDTKKLALYHSTHVEDVPLAICGYGGRVLVSVGPKLRLYDLGKKKLLRKCQSDDFPNMLRTIDTAGGRIFVGDVQESMHCVLYSPETNTFGTLSIDVIPRYITCACPLDFETVAGGDKFGNIFVLQIPDNASTVDFATLSGPQTLWSGDAGEKMNRFKDLTQFHVGEVITSIVKKPMVIGGADILVYTTIMGSVGTLYPFVSAEDADFFVLLEIAMRREIEILSGWRHIGYRGFYAPVKHTIDGDLCELFSTLPTESQKEIASTLDCKIEEILKKIEDTRNVAYF
jgi:splicing factor 3B subunit 3